MSALNMADNITTEAAMAIKAIFGERLDKVVLYGSRARGDASEESDYDLAIFLSDYANRFAEFERVSGLQADFLIKYGAVLSPMIYRAADYDKKTPLMFNVRKEGITL